uniref:Uncharacterized protein n=1 Tax=Molossus molossus TaxID=27622 RepID=A0A7J8CS02_MOLMO|nr:hypothetical protein HJG59_009809 [Molossus molossus]
MFPVRFCTSSFNATLAPNIFGTYLQLSSKWTRRELSLFLQPPHIGRTDGRTDRHTDTHMHNYLPYVPAGLQMMPLVISKNMIHPRVSIHPYRGHSKERTGGMTANISFPTLDIYSTQRQSLLRFCQNHGRNTPIKRAYFANKILQPLFKIQHKLASLVRQQADSIPLSRASFIYIKFNTVSSSQSDNRVRELN